MRDYTEEDCRWVEFIKCMRGAGLPVEALIEYVALFQQGDSTSDAQKEILYEQRKLLVERLEEMQKTLEKQHVGFSHWTRLHGDEFRLWPIQ